MTAETRRSEHPVRMDHLSAVFYDESPEIDLGIRYIADRHLFIKFTLAHRYELLVSEPIFNAITTESQKFDPHWESL